MVFKIWHKKLGMTVDLCMAHGIYAHARFDDLDLEARSQWVGKGKKFSFELSLYNKASKKH